MNPTHFLGFHIADKVHTPWEWNYICHLIDRKFPEVDFNEVVYVIANMNESRKSIYGPGYAQIKVVAKSMFIKFTIPKHNLDNTTAFLEEYYGERDKLRAINMLRGLGD